MANLLQSLSLGAGAMQASTYGSRVAANNIANVSTAGYSRQTLLQSTASSPLLGVKVDGVARNIDQSIARQLRNQSGASAGSSTRSQYLGRIESALDVNGDGGIAAKLDSMFAAYRRMAASPTDGTTRAAALAAVGSVASAVRTTASNLVELQRDADSTVNAAVTEANSVAARVASLNAAIGGMGPVKTQELSQLIDERDQALNRLSELVGAEAHIDDRNIATVSVGGVGIVIGDSQRVLRSSATTVSGFRDIVVDAPTPVILNDKLGPSIAKSAIDTRDVSIANRLSELDTFARDFATAANAIQSAGYGTDGSTGTPLLTTGSANGALTLALDPAIAGQPQKLGTSNSATSPGNIAGIDAFLGLETAKVSGGGTQTLQEAAQANITNAGSEAALAAADEIAQASRYSQLNAAREQVSGVSIEDEMLSIERYQRAYQAAARVITTVNEMLDTLMRM